MVSAIDDSDDGATPGDDVFSVPLLGTRTAAQHQRLLSILLGLALFALVIVGFWTVSRTDKGARQVGAIGQSLMQSQRLAKSVSQALVQQSPVPVTVVKHAEPEELPEDDDQDDDVGAQD